MLISHLYLWRNIDSSPLPILFKNQYFKKMYFFLAVLDLVAAWAFLYLWCTGSLWQWLLFLWASVAVALGVSGWHPLGSRVQAP